jgi:probable HAF family extracellular repeat protein
MRTKIAATATIALCITVFIVTAGRAQPPHYSVMDLGTLGGSESFATGVNDLGQVTGGASVAGNASSHPFLYSGGIMMDLGILAGGVDGYGEAVNVFGEVVGHIVSTQT